MPPIHFLIASSISLKGVTASVSSCLPRTSGDRAPGRLWLPMLVPSQCRSSGRGRDVLQELVVNSNDLLASGCTSSIFWRPRDLAASVAPRPEPGHRRRRPLLRRPESPSLTQTLVIPIQSELPELLHTSGANAAWVITVTLLGGRGRDADRRTAGRPLRQAAGAGRPAPLCWWPGRSSARSPTRWLPMLVGRALQGLADGLHPGRHLADARDHAAAHDRHRDRRDERRPSASAARSGCPCRPGRPELADWHALFWVAAGLAAVVVARGVASWCRTSTTPQPGRFDVRRRRRPGGRAGHLPGRGLQGQRLGLGFGRAPGARSSAGWSCSSPGARYELRQREPAGRPPDHRAPPVLLTNIAAVAIGFGMMAQSIVVPQLLEHAVGHRLRARPDDPRGRSLDGARRA